MPYAPDLAGAALDGRYELHALIGEGTFGRVYRGIDRRLRRPVAIKVIKPWWGEDPEWAERFEREAQLLARVSDPGIVQIFDVGQCDEGLYYVAELVEGESLAARLRRGRLSARDAAGIAEQLCRALAHTHASGVIHRDIKPANVLLTRRGKVKLSDFSIARLAEGSSEGQATIAGTPKYMAPEQARGLPATPATDLYSVGVVLYEMLAGHPPFAAGTAVELALRHLQDPPPPLPPDVAPGLSSVVARALQKDPEHRYATAAAMAAGLAAARIGDRSQAPSHEPATAPRRERSAATREPPGPAGRRAATGPSGTRVAPELGPRRNVNPAARRRAVALVVLVAALGLGMLFAAHLIGAVSRASVPNTLGLTRGAAEHALSRAGLRPRFSRRFDSRPAGRVIAQSPAAKRRVTRGATVRVVLSAGPPPVVLPPVTGESRDTATATLTRLGLRARVHGVPAPGNAPGTVTAQSPGAGQSVAAHSAVMLSVAQAPQWRGRSTFSGTDAGRSPVFHIEGRQWRVVYRMGYVGTCTFIVFCSGPSAHVRNLDTGQSTSFDLANGAHESQTFTSGPGRYRIEVSPGNDTASWSIEIQDYY
jgi:eukaryotic-like serine/threonine-protein kinase